MPPPNRRRIQRAPAMCSFVPARSEPTGQPSPLDNETITVMIDVERAGMTASDVVNKLKDHDVLMVEFNPTRVRAVTHMDVTRADVERAAQVLAEVMG